MGRFVDDEKMLIPIHGIEPEHLSENRGAALLTRLAKVQVRARAAAVEELGHRIRDDMVAERVGKELDRGAITAAGRNGPIAKTFGEGDHAASNCRKSVETVVVLQRLSGVFALFKGGVLRIFYNRVVRIEVGLKIRIGDDVRNIAGKIPLLSADSLQQHFVPVFVGSKENSDHHAVVLLEELLHRKRFVRVEIKKAGFGDEVGEIPGMEAGRFLVEQVNHRPVPSNRR